MTAPHFLMVPIRSPFERRLYELVRKHCGDQPQWKIGLDNLRVKVGSKSPLKRFKEMVGKTIEKNNEHAHIPDYVLALDETRGRGRDVVIVTRRTPKPKLTAPALALPVPLTDEQRATADRTARYNAFKAETGKGYSEFLAHERRTKRDQGNPDE